MCLGFVVAGSNIILLALLFILAGVYIGIVDALERALAADLLPLAQRATGYGFLATANSIGDLVSSIVVGFSRGHVSTAAGFFYGAALTLAGCAALFAGSGATIQ